MTSLNKYAEMVHHANRNWWIDLTKPCPLCIGKGTIGGVVCADCDGMGFGHLDRNIGEMLMLCVTELSEAMEGHRKNLMDNHLPTRKMFDVEIVDCVIRLFDLAGAHIPDFDTIFWEKMVYNQKRPDHQIEERLKENGKKC